MTMAMRLMGKGADGGECGRDSRGDGNDDGDGDDGGDGDEGDGGDSEDDAGDVCKNDDVDGRDGGADDGAGDCSLTHDDAVWGAVAVGGEGGDLFWVAMSAACGGR